MNYLLCDQLHLLSDLYWLSLLIAVANFVTTFPKLTDSANYLF